jgi:hypothetical protein
MVNRVLCCIVQSWDCTFWKLLVFVNACLPSAPTGNRNAVREASCWSMAAVFIQRLPSPSSMHTCQLGGCMKKACVEQVHVLRQHMSGCAKERPGALLICQWVHMKQCHAILLADQLRPCSLMDMYMIQSVFPPHTGGTYVIPQCRAHPFPRRPPTRWWHESDEHDAVSLLTLPGCLLPLHSCCCS